MNNSAAMINLALNDLTLDAFVKLGNEAKLCFDLKDKSVGAASVYRHH